MSGAASKVRWLALAGTSPEHGTHSSAGGSAGGGAAPPDACGAAFTPLLICVKLLPPSATTAPEGRPAAGGLAPDGGATSSSRLCSSWSGTAVRLLMTTCGSRRSICQQKQGSPKLGGMLASRTQAPSSPRLVPDDWFEQRAYTHAWHAWQLLPRRRAPRPRRPDLDKPCSLPVGPAGAPATCQRR